jgi:hypothetical protein
LVSSGEVVAKSGVPENIHRGPADLGIRAAGLVVTESAGVADAG